MSSTTHLLQRRPEEQTWVVVGPKHALAHLSPLIEAHSRHRPVRVVESNELLASHLAGAASVLWIGDPRRSPRTAIPGMFVRAADGRRVPAGWLPDVGQRLADYGRAAAEVTLRQAPAARRGPFVLLGEFERRALEWVGWFSDELPQNAGVFQWTAERIRRQDLIPALQVGAGAAFYFGRGTPLGWFGYGGFDQSDAAAACGYPIGCIISFCCSVARRPAKGLSFCEELVLSGLCAAAIGSTRLSLHHRNVEWSLAFGNALRRRESATLSDLLADPSIPLAALNSYRILGDPMAPLIGHADSRAQSAGVFAPAPDEALQVVPLR